MDELVVQGATFHLDLLPQGLPTARSEQVRSHSVRKAYPRLSFQALLPLISSIPSQEELDRTLPLKTPYWLQEVDGRRVGAPGVRATWIGHASVLAEVDGATVLTDPMFSKRPSPVQWGDIFGLKRYRPPGEPCCAQS